jgi:hypothetical protein
MLSLNTQNINKFTLLGYITLLQLWWIAVWGIAYIIIEYYSNKSKSKELAIYFILLVVVLFLVLKDPDLIERL